METLASTLIAFRRAMEDELDTILSELNYDNLSFDTPFLLNDYSTDSILSANNHAATDSASSNSCSSPSHTDAYSVCTGLLRYIRETRPETEINIFKDPAFSGFQRILDGEMKRLRSLGLGVKRKQAEPITIAEEKLLLERGLLGDSSPKCFWTQCSSVWSALCSS